MGDYLRKQSRDIVFSVCQYGMSDVWKWGDSVGGNCWRTTNDITDTWTSVKNIALDQDKSAPYAKPGTGTTLICSLLVLWGGAIHT